MQVARVGRSGLSVSRLCLGSMYFGGKTQEREAVQMMDAALDAGIVFWDTSNMYNAGRSEEVVGRGLRELGARERVVLASKVFYPRGRPNDRGAGVATSCKNSTRSCGACRPSGSISTISIVPILRRRSTKRSRP